MMRSPAPDPGAGSDPAEEYREARARAVLADLSARGRLALFGSDAADLMHRLTTNAIRDLKPGEGRPAVFTTPKGRIIDLVLLHRMDDHLLCTTGAGRGPAVAAWIDRYTFRDDVRIEDRTASHATLGIYGPRAAGVASVLSGGDPGGWPVHNAERFDREGAGGVLARTYPLGGDGFFVTVEAGRLAGIRDRLTGSEPGLRTAGESCLEALRIEAGLPAPDRELTEDYNPWEAGLADAIALDKGCYVGQEVIARLNTYKKVSKTLVRLHIAGGRAPSTGSPLEYAGSRTGTLTSAVVVPGEGRVIALGYVQDEHAEGGMELVVAAPEGRAGATIEGPAR